MLFATIHRLQKYYRFLATLPERSWAWFQAHGTGAHAERWLVALSFSESSFFLIPPDALLIPMLAAGAKRWARLALITTVASVLGALFGYVVGALAFESVGVAVVGFYGLEDAFEHVGTLYDTHTFLSVFTAAFTPIPFKVFVLAGGFFKVSLIPFIAASILGRGMRFYLVAYLAARFGPRAAEAFLQYFKWVTVAVVALLALVFVYYYAWVA